MPYIFVDGQIRKITKLVIEKSNSRIENNFIQKDFVPNSVLKSGTGEWYKIAVSKDGIYKVDYDFLVAMGFNVNNLNSDWINVFGNGDGRLPELNSVERTDDLAKNSIQIFDGQDGVFGPGDYLIFYGWGPHRWFKDLSKFDNDRNPYSDVSYYFININSNDTPERIQNLPLEDGAVTNVVSDYNYRTLKEDDFYNLVGGGQRWYGDLFDTELSKNYGFNIPNIVSSDSVDFIVSLASNPSSSSGTKQKYSFGNTVLGEWTLPSGGSGNYGRSVRTFKGKFNSSGFTLRMDIIRNSPSNMTYLDRILINARASLALTGNELSFRDVESIGVGNLAEFTVSQLSTNSLFGMLRIVIHQEE